MLRSPLSTLDHAEDVVLADVLLNRATAILSLPYLLRLAQLCSTVPAELRSARQISRRR